MEPKETTLKDVSDDAFRTPENLAALLNAKDPFEEVVKKKFPPPYSPEVQHINMILKVGGYQGAPPTGGKPVPKGWTIVHGRQILQDLYDIWMVKIPSTPNPGKPSLKVDPWKGYA